MTKCGFGGIRYDRLEDKLSSGMQGERGMLSRCSLQRTSIGRESIYSAKERSIGLIFFSVLRIRLSFQCWKTSGPLK